MELTILIPTYNRCRDLSENLEHLQRMICAHSLLEKVSILVSDNCSTDGTSEIIEKFKKKTQVAFFAFCQNTNIGLERNALFCLEKSKTKWVMFLGDDDFIDERYLLAARKAFAEISDGGGGQSDLTCVVPSFMGITPERKELNVGRDLGESTKLYEKGFKSCRVNSVRGHQLSGLVFKREGLLDAYRKSGAHNLYPFIYFVCYAALHGKILHIPEYPVKVTQPGPGKKDWGYGDDGLLSDIFDNYKRLGVNIFQRFLLEFEMIRRQPFRYTMYFSKSSPLAVIKTIGKISFGKNTSVLSSIILPFWFFYYIAKGFGRKVLHKIIPRRR